MSLLHIAAPTGHPQGGRLQNNTILENFVKSLHGDLNWECCELFLGAFSNLGKATISPACLPVRLFAWNNSAPTGRILMKLNI
jgi:hypothetical protein